MLVIGFFQEAVQSREDFLKNFHTMDFEKIFSVLVNHRTQKVATELLILFHNFLQIFFRVSLCGYFICMKRQCKQRDVILTSLVYNETLYNIYVDQMNFF